MPGESFSISDIVQQLPRRLQVRFESLRGYVQGILDEENAKLNQQIKLTAEDIQFVQLAVFIYGLDGFFRAGSSAARGAASTFTSFGAKGGFQVGQSVFTEDNENTRRGDELASELQLAISNSPVSRLIKNASSMNALVRSLLSELKK